VKEETEDEKICFDFLGTGGMRIDRGSVIDGNKLPENGKAGCACGYQDG